MAARDHRGPRPRLGAASLARERAHTSTPDRIHHTIDYCKQTCTVRLQPCRVPPGQNRRDHSAARTRHPTHARCRRGRLSSMSTPARPSQEVVGRRLLGRHAPCLLRRVLKYLELAVEVLVQLQDGRHVAAAVAVVGRRPDRHQRVAEHPLEALHHQLVRAADEVQVVALEEGSNHVRTKGERHAAVVLAPAHDVLVRVGPQQVAQQARVGHVRGPHDALDLVHRGQLGRQAAVHAKDLLVHDGRDGQAVEAVGVRLPELDVVAPLALVVEAVYPVDARALVVPAQDEKVLGVLDLVRQQQADGLQALLPAVHIVAQEEIVCVGREAAVLKQAQQVVVLSVDVAADLDRRLEL
mmetsp:Transcript_76524/g.211821  ORF Transcript_76524/g.211821 Transcript_76524/m.211821 type:complete len:353 (-) Transcript_76524:157-1215(-)